MASSPDPCNTGLSLGFTGTGSGTAPKPSYAGHLRFDQGLPSLSLGPADQGCGFSGSPGGSSSYSNNGNSGKRSADHGGDDVEVDKASDEEEEASPRKKLRLTKDQSAVLEDSFKEHSTLNPNQKQALAKRLNLRPRQVEVWFQNRRARTKLKQTEMDCELLKKCCETLSEENKRLQKEVQELKALKLAAPAAVYMPGAATLSICPSCERFVAGAAASPAGDHQHRHLTTAKAAAKPHQFFSHPSAAC